MSGNKMKILPFPLFLSIECNLSSQGHWFPRTKTSVSVSALNGRGDISIAEVILLLSVALLHARSAQPFCEISKAAVLGGIGCFSPTRVFFQTVVVHRLGTND